MPERDKAPTVRFEPPAEEWGFAEDPTMRVYICRFVPFDEQLWGLPNRDACYVVFRFELIPAEFFGQPDESQHTEQQSIGITVTGASFFEGGIPRDDEDKMRVLYWHAVKTLERDEDSLRIDSVYAAEHRVDPSRIVFPPSGPFEIVRPVKMGFHT